MPNDADQPADPSALDPDALREKYRIERDKRLRDDGDEQYIETTGAFAHYVEDPYVEPGFTRAPLEDEVDVAVIGAGFGGLIAGARLREAGVDRIRLIDKAGDVGGTWYWNRYPGIACDIESYVYMPLLEEVGTMPTEKYSRGKEIFEHCQAIARKFDLYRDICLQTEVREIRWDDEAGRWIIETNRGDAMRARFVCLAQGFLQKPKLPGLPGIEKFAGHAFHTSRWDFEYTGGDSNGALEKLADKRVGIIGTGASAVQCIPHLGRDAKQLFVFQRTPSSVDVRANSPTDPAWVETLEPGWHQRRMENFQTLTTGGFEAEDLVHDGWTDIVAKVLFVMQSSEGGTSPEDIEAQVEKADFLKMNEIRQRVEDLIDDPATAESLKPWYRQFCKRPCFHDEYLQTFNRPNVTLVDTDGKGVERVTERGVISNGDEVELDCLIFATGFEVNTEFERRAGYTLVGREGRSLQDAWSAGIRTLHGIHMRGFPNCYMMSIAQSGVSVNFPYLLDLQARHIAYTIGRAIKEDIERLEVSEAAEQEWVDTVLRLAGERTSFQESCTPGYYNSEGRPSPLSRQNGFFFGEPNEYRDLLSAWREDGTMKGLERS